MSNSVFISDQEDQQNGHQQQQQQQPQSESQQQEQQPQQQQQQQQQQQNQQPPYTIPGILHYLQYEWHRFEVERQEWEVEKAELSARIALLQGEKKSHENLKHDLIRRIKMLEYCLRMERAKYFKLKHGTDPPPVEGINQTSGGNVDENNDPDLQKGAQNAESFINSNNNSSTVTYGRELLRHYLQEIGYTDTIIDLRSNRVRSLLGIVDSNPVVNQQQQQPQSQPQLQLNQQPQPSSPPSLQQQQQQPIPPSSQPQQTPPQQQQQPDDVGDAEASVLATFDFLYESMNDSGQPRKITTANNQVSQQQQQQQHQLQQQQQQQQPKSDVVDIGELATLTSLGSDTTIDDDRRKQWIAKYRLQSHYDCVRALKFSETDTTLVTASEDETIKLWHLSKSSDSGKSRQANLPPAINAISSLEGSTLDIEPLQTYRGHTSRILSITLCKNHIFSGAQNGEIIMWKMVSDPSTVDQYDKFDSSLLVCKYVGHEDSVWALEVVDQPKAEPLLCSASADLTIKIWNTTGEKKVPLGVISLESSPTCIVKMPLYNVCQAGADIAVSFCDGKIRLYDIATCLNNTESNTQPIATFECDDSRRINSIVIHPTLPYMASADCNHDIKFWDLKTRKCKSTMVAHLDEVTSLACDPTGKYLLSASHDCSVRIWLFEEKSCIQEITSHRKKYDEGIFAVAFHPSFSHFATAGADGLAKVFM